MAVAMNSFAFGQGSQKKVSGVVTYCITEGENSKQKLNIHSEDEDEFKSTVSNDFERWPTKRHAENLEKQEQLFCFVYVYLNVILIVLIIILVDIILIEKNSPLPMSELCFSRTLIESHPYDREELAFCNTTHCCFQNMNATGKMIQNITSRLLKEKILKDPERRFTRYECDYDINQTKTVIDSTIKLVAPLKRKRPSTKCTTCVVWNISSNNAILPKNPSYFTLHEEMGFIEINEPGMYHVYSQVNINYGDNILQNFFHVVIARKYIGDVRTETLLMRNSNSQCVCNKNKQLFSSYLGSDFYLHERTKLAV